MDDSFAYRTTVPIRRQVDPRVIRAAVGGIAALAAIVLFATWVVASERESFERAVRHGSAPAPSVAIVGPTAPPTAGADVEEALGSAADAARTISGADGGFAAATPARLAELERDYTYVDGPSTAATVVSVASTRDAWAAAVLGPDGACSWIALSLDGPQARATGTECTGAAALASMSARGASSSRPL